MLLIVILLPQRYVYIGMITCYLSKYLKSYFSVVVEKFTCYQHVLAALEKSDRANKMCSKACNFVHFLLYTIELHTIILSRTDSDLASGLMLNISTFERPSYCKCKAALVYWLTNACLASLLGLGNYSAKLPGSRPAEPAWSSPPARNDLYLAFSPPAPIFGKPVGTWQLQIILGPTARHSSDHNVFFYRVFIHSQTKCKQTTNTECM